MNKDVMDKHEYTVEELLKDHQIFHSDLQMDCFITGLSGGTPFGMYKQALRELDKRHRALRHLHIERERLRMKIPSKVVGWFRSKCHKLWALADIEAGFALEDQGRTIGDTWREFARFLQQARALKKKVGELTPKTRAVLDQIFWEDHLRRTAAVELLTSGGLTPNTLGCINAMPVAARATLLAECHQDNRERLMAWYVRTPLPDVLALPGLPGDLDGLIGERFDGSVPSKAVADSPKSGVNAVAEQPGARRLYGEPSAHDEAIRRNDELIRLVLRDPEPKAPTSAPEPDESPG